jgi:hypothetical protein
VCVWSGSGSGSGSGSVSVSVSVSVCARGVAQMCVCAFACADLSFKALTFGVLLFKSLSKPHGLPRPS